MAGSATKRFIKRHFPPLVSALHFLRRLPLRSGTMEERFQRMIRMYVRQQLESLSGPGSTLEETRVIRAQIPILLANLDVKVLLDIPCGDFHWMKEVELKMDRYIGADVLADLIRANKEKFERTNRTFLRLDLTVDDLPEADLVFCRDCLVHLSFADIFRAFANIKRSGATYLLTTTFPSVGENLDILTGEWRRLNLEMDPFNLPAPLRLLNEECTIPLYSDKSLGLWRVSDLPDKDRPARTAGPIG